MITENVFVDTSAWTAIADNDDVNHKKAVTIYPSLLKEYKALFTTNLVIAESYILILKTLGHRAAIRFLESVNVSPRIIKIYSTEDIEREAEKILRKYTH
jgi:predicted nucleic acid-binding protein